MGKIKQTLSKYPLLRIFLKSMCISFIVIIACIGVFALSTSIFFKKVSVSTTAVVAEKSQSVEEEVEEEILKEPATIKKNIVVFGVDQGEARTDTILLVHFDSTTSRINVMSIPRDTKVTWTQAQQDLAVQLGRSYSYTSKITDMSSLGGIDNLRQFTISTIEDMLKIKVDNYVVVNTSMLREVVDKIGGVEVDVPRVMQYTDKSQGLYIDLQPGLQLLNGQQAEGLLRWRHDIHYNEQYAQGDLGRIETQHLFIEAFAKKVLSIRSIPQITGLISSVYKNIKTDITLTEALSYVAYLKDLSVDKMTFKTLPGESAREDGLWYFFPDEIETSQYIDMIFTE